MQSVPPEKTLLGMHTFFQQYSYTPSKTLLRSNERIHGAILKLSTKVTLQNKHQKSKELRIHQFLFLTVPKSRNIIIAPALTITEPRISYPLRNIHSFRTVSKTLIRQSNQLIHRPLLKVTL